MSRFRSLLGKKHIIEKPILEETVAEKAEREKLELERIKTYEERLAKEEADAESHRKKVNLRIIWWFIFSIITFSVIVTAFFAFFGTISESYRIDGTRIIINSPYPYGLLIGIVIVLGILLKIAHSAYEKISQYEYKLTGMKRGVMYIGRNYYGDFAYRDKKLIPLEKIATWMTFGSCISVFIFLVWTFTPPMDTSIVKNFANNENVKILSDQNGQYHLNFDNSSVKANNGVYAMKERNDSFTRQGELIPIADSVDVVVKSDEIDKLVEERTKQLELERAKQLEESLFN